MPGLHSWGWFGARRARASQSSRSRRRLEVETLENRLVPAGATANQHLVAQAYLDVLQRQVDLGGLTFWSSALDQGLGRIQFAATLENSTEFRQREVEDIYNRFLARTAEPAGLAAWTGFLQSGGRIEQLEAAVAASAEFFIKNGSNNAGFLNGLYPALLGRPIDAGGARGWSQVLAAGISRGQVATLIEGGSEFLSNEVNSAYTRFLHRPADAPGHDFWVGIDKFIGVDALIANFVGSPEYFTFSQGTVTPVTTTTVTSSVNGALSLGQSVTFTATVSPNARGPFTATGMVTFLDNGSPLGAGSLNASGQATFTTAALVPGGHAITAIYTGDANFTASTSSPFNQSVGQQATTTGLLSSSNPSNLTQSVTFTAIVTPHTVGSFNATGTVTFMDGNTTLATPSLDGTGKATFTTSTLTTGTHNITAVYAGDANFTGSTSPTVNQMVSTTTKTVTTVMVGTSGTPSNLGQSVTFTATVTPPTFGANVISGTVTFTDGVGGPVLGSPAIDATGHASIMTAALGGAPANSPHTIVATYSGDANFTNGSATVDQAVNKATTGVSVTASAGTVNLGQSVMVTATVTNNVVGSFTAGGTVNFTDGVGGAVVGSGTLNASGQASANLTLPAGGHTIVAVYGGDANFAGSASSGAGNAAVTVNAQTTTSVALSGVNNVGSASQGDVVLMVQVSPGTAGSFGATGTVQIKEGATVLATVDVSNGAGTSGTITLAGRNYSLTLVYSGDGNFTGHTSSQTLFFHDPDDTTIGGEEDLNGDQDSFFALN